VFAPVARAARFGPRRSAVRLETVAANAATGVDAISSGSLTQSSKALDIGLDIVAG
jgi:nicotinate-nucleotide pyrophosphorylase